MKRYCAVFAVAAALASQGAYAQADADKKAGEAGRPSGDEAASEAIVVTGSRIRGIAPVGSPVVSLGRTDVLQSGKNNTAEILRQMPQVVALGATEALGGGGQDATANQSRAQGLNIRGLGTRATLVLWNGNRVVGMGGFGNFVDPSTFPTVALERVEIVADGASAIYGSDAVSGVANIITRRNFDGIEANARYGIADGGYHEFAISAIAGKTWSGGHFNLSAEHSGHNLLLATKRAFVTSDQRPFGGADFRSTFCRPGNLTAGGTTNYPLPAGNGVGLTPAQLAAGSPNRCDLQALGTILPKQARDTVLSSFAQELAPDIELFADAFWTKRTFLNANVPTATVTVPSTNPFFVTPVAGRTSVAVAYNFYPEIGYTYTPGYEKAVMAVGGLRAKVGGDWRVELSGSIGRSDDLTNNTQQANATAIAAAVADTNPATSLNVFGSAYTNNAATLSNLFTGLFVIKGYNVLKSVNGSAQGSLFDLPGGAVKLSVGGEYRSELNFGILTRGTQSAPLAGDPFRGTRTVSSVFGEVYLPILRNSGIPGLQSLNLSLALRHEHYSDVGNTTNPKVGVTWVPLEGLSLRGSYGRSFRAPSIAEANFKSAGYGINVNTALADPLSPTGVSNGISLVGGNPDLAPEKSRTYTIGADLRPLPGLSLSTTFFSISYTGQIADLVNPTVLQSPFYSAYVIRNPTQEQIQQYLNFGGSPLPISLGTLPATVSFIIDARRHNLGDTKMEGLDFDLGYQFGTAIGDWNLHTSATLLTRLAVSAAPGAPVVDVKGHINRAPEFRLRSEVGFRSGPVSAQIAANYATSYINDLTAPAYRIPANTTFDLFVGYSLGKLVPALKDGSLSLTINNVFDRDPPHSNTALGYDPQSASALGRTMAVALNTRF
ncbi:TonB-dependent receptor [Novosphingobium flavum]|uniref:TonB-dependent receptor n=1 Tax=Novosphingobium flavum TaxID=1778672 RepID=A0A7X1FNV7_9SPHN|nr:TonB-dependent receptor [Novosphingobium flavum]MBC2664163.1 TonB-dependent receptor [Novosphingobium flavum]